MIDLAKDAATAIVDRPEYKELVSAFGYFSDIHLLSAFTLVRSVLSEREGMYLCKAQSWRLNPIATWEFYDADPVCAMQQLYDAVIATDFSTAVWPPATNNSDRWTGYL